MGKFILENVVKSFPQGKNSDYVVLDGINFEWNEDEILAIMGESGSGKSTIAKMLVGLEKPTCGEITFNNEDITKWGAKQWRKNRKIIQAVFQDASGTLNNGLSVYKNLEEPLINLTDLKAKERREIISELMEQTGMSQSLLKVKTKKLSGGEQRRLSLLRALAIKPKFLILDEVTNGLDFKVEDEICNLLREYHQKYNIAYLLITHDEGIAKKLSTRILYMKDGRFMRVGRKE